MMDRAIRWGASLVIAGLYSLLIGFQLWKTSRYRVGDETDVIWANVLTLPWSLFPKPSLNYSYASDEAFAWAWISLRLNTLALFLITLWIFSRIGRAK